MSEVVGGQASSTVGQSVLLVDVNLRRRESRAAHLRKLGAVVDCASNATTALQKFGATTYRLVLIDLERAAAEQLAGEIRLKDPKQLVGFMVEGPTLISKTLAAAETYNVATLLVTGGVAANSDLRTTFEREGAQAGMAVYFPSRPLSTDNAAMIAAAAYPKFLAGEFAPMDISAEAGLVLR